MSLAGLLAALILMAQVATPSAAPSPLILESCPVTLPNGVDPANVEPPGHWYGKDGLHVGIPPDGIYYAKREPGQTGGWNKHIWVDEVVGRPLTVAVDPSGEHTTSEKGRAIPSPGSPVMEIWFPDDGCWTITGTTPDVTISVTV